MNNKWHTLKEELPNLGQIVLVNLDSWGYALAHYTYDRTDWNKAIWLPHPDFFGNTVDKLNPDSIKHWCDLPELPDETP